MIFETKRLSVRKLKASDTDAFFELMSNPNVMHPIPQPVFTRQESDSKLAELIGFSSTNDKRIWCLTEKGKDELIGFCGLLINNEGDEEIAYRLIERFWGKGFGTETALGLINYCFDQLKVEKVTADVNIENNASAKILQKFMQPVRTFFNPNDQCTDRRYQVFKKNWKIQSNV